MCTTVRASCRAVAADDAAAADDLLPDVFSTPIVVFSWFEMAG